MKIICENLLTNKERLDLLQKMIVRTDGFHNYANTKSTIILTFIAALIAAICTNINKPINYLVESDILHIVVVFKVILFLLIALLISSLFITLETIIPFIKKSNKKNIFSFIDIIQYYKTENDFNHDISNIEYDSLVTSLSSLQYNLSIGLSIKYKKHKMAIDLIKWSMVLIIVEIIIVFLA